MYNEFLGQVHFWLFFIGVNVLFFPMHFLGLGRHAASHSRLSGRYTKWNTLATEGYAIMAFSMIFSS